MTPFQKHYRQWKNCDRCLLHTQRTHVVIASGNVPCEIAFIGEAPGACEDVLAEPFVGPAGHLLDRIIKESVPLEATIGKGNLVGCFPSEVKGDPDRSNEPPKEAIKACRPRLEELLELFSPRVLVAVGELAAKNLKWYDGAEHKVKIIHPAAILRADVSQQGLLIKRSIVTISNCFLPF